MGDEPGRLEEAKSEALAAFAAIAAVIDLAGEPETGDHASAISALRGEAVRHLSAALELMRRAKGVGG
jgi:hypothetical protein